MVVQDISSIRDIYHQITICKHFPGNIELLKKKV